MVNYDKPINGSLSIIVVDMQEYYSRLSHCRLDKLIDAQIEVLKLAERRDMPVINLRYAVKKSRTIREIAQEVRRIPRHRFIVKPGTDGFQGTNLYEILKKFQTREIFFMGLETSSCVLDTAKTAKKRGIKISSSRDVTLDLCINPDMFDYNGDIWLLQNGHFYESYKEHPALR